MNVYKYYINLSIKKKINKYVAIYIMMHIASQIGGEQQNMRQFQTMSLVTHS